MKLPLEDFKALIKNGILLSIDLIIKNESGEVLVGQRKNNPAKGYWFVPGGRVFKNESFADAIHRICEAEAGLLNPDFTYSMIGMFNHIYDDNFFNDPEFNTHYLAIGIEVSLDDINMQNTMLSQHEDSKFMSIPALLNDKNVHSYTKYYFTENAPNRFL